jgi:hypothetical protein
MLFLLGDGNWWFIFLRYADARTNYRALLPESLHDKLRPIWGLDKEGELNSIWREVGGRGKEGNALNGIWCMMGNLALCRFHSKHIALRESFPLFYRSRFDELDAIQKSKLTKRGFLGRGISEGRCASPVYVG